MPESGETATAETAATEAAVAAQLPADHPLVRTLEKLKMEAKDLRRDNQAGAAALQRLAAIEEAQKTEAQKVADRAAELDGRATKAESEAMRLRVAMRKGLTETQAKRLIGDTDEALEADADELLASFRQGVTEPENTETPAPTGRPKEALKSGATPSGDGTLPQLTREDLKGMKPEAIEAARVAGQLNKIQGIT